MSEKWPQRELFVNFVLLLGLAWEDLLLEEVEFDGVAGVQFDKVLGSCAEDEWCENRKDLIRLALKLEVPVEGLEADGEFGPEWAEVVALCKEDAVIYLR